MQRKALTLIFTAYCVYISRSHNESQYRLMQSIMKLIEFKPNVCLSVVHSSDKTIDPPDDETIRTLIERHPLYILSPVESEDLNAFTVGPWKPYPCVYLVRLDRQSDSALRFFMNGTYGSNWHSSNESTYILYSRSRYEINEIQKVIRTLFNFGILNVIFVNSGPVEVYIVFPFGRNLTGCPENSGPPVKIGEILGGELRLNENPTPFKIPTKFSGCAFRISAAKYHPHLIVDGEQPLDSIMTDGNRVGGFDAVAMKFLASHYNLKIEWRVFGDGQWKTLVDNRTWFGSVPLFVEGQADVCCGGITNFFTKSADPVGYVVVKTVVYAPVPDLKPKWKMVYCGFSQQFWCSFAGVIVIFPIVFWLIAREVDPGLSLSKTFVVAVGIAFSNTPSSFKRSSVVFYVMEYVWKYFTQHICMAYAAYLAGFVTYRNYEPLIRTKDQLIDSELPVAAFSLTANFFLGYNDSLSTHIKSRYIAIPLFDFEEKLLTMSRFKNMTIIDSSLYVDYLLKHDVSSAQVYNTGITLARVSVGLLVFRHSYWAPIVDAAMSRMVESGVMEKILSDLISNVDWKRHLSHERELKSLKLVDLSGPFYVLILGYCVSLCAFFAEVLNEYYKRKRSVRFILSCSRNRPIHGREKRSGSV